MKIADVRKLEKDALISKLKDLKEEEFNLKIQVVTQQTENFRPVYAVRRDIARVKTVLTEISKKDVSAKK